MKKYVVSQKKAMELKDAGYVQESEHYWIDVYTESSPKSSYGVNHRGHWMVKMQKLNPSGFRPMYSAPLSDELLERLPEYINPKGKSGTPSLVHHYIYFVKRDNKYCVIYIPSRRGHGRKPVEIESDTLPDALADMWIYLDKEKLL